MCKHKKVFYSFFSRLDKVLYFLSFLQNSSLHWRIASVLAVVLL